jgi:hypothetical protein
MEVLLNEDGPYLDYETKDRRHGSINLRALAEETGNDTLLKWCEEQLEKPRRRRRIEVFLQRASNS